MEKIIDLKAKFLLVVLLAVVSFGWSPRPDDPRKGLAVFIDGIRLSIDRDSLSITAKGTLTLRYADGTPMKSKMSVRVLIRHRNYAGNMLLFPWDEEYMPAKPLMELELPDLLKKMKHGDQLVLVPLYSSETTPIVINITADNC